ncbi:MAG: high-affinity iron transporter, partial [Solirubrobacteraceae bacterium]|nr:high-affinity iron transporter [Solirubrobacteraceae bacterium]
MLPTFVIGLREGVEASLIVGIVAAFLAKQGRGDALRWMWTGVAGAIALCVAAALALEAINEDLPQRQQEGLETIVAFAAVGMVTFMVVWMRRHAAGLAAELRTNAAEALGRGSLWALVGMAFFAVLREGLETAVFLLAAFQHSADPAAAGGGAAIGIAVAVVIGFGIYRGGVRLNLGRFFRATAAVLVLVAAGLVASALHTAHEATWLNAGQSQAVDLSWLIHPGTITSSLATGILGLQPKPTVSEALGWLLYAVPLLAFVLWPDRRRRIRGRAPVMAAVVVAAVLLLAACGSSSDKGATAAKGARVVRVELTDAGCRPEQSAIAAGATTFAITNNGSAKNTEFEIVDANGVIVGEKENIAGGLSGSFTLNLDPGRYVAQCPSADTPKTALTVTGQAVAAASDSGELTAATGGWKRYVAGQAAKLLTATRAFAGAVQAGDVQRAKALFARARSHYERIEPVAESFGGLDPAIDARVNDVAAGDRWTGFHRIEQALWVTGSTAGVGGTAARLVRDVTRLHDRIPSLSFQAPQLANGAVELLNEVAKSKIGGEEDRYSRTDLSDFQANLDGAREAFALLRPALAKR